MSKLNKKVGSVAPYGQVLSANGNLQDVKAPYQILFETVVGTLYGKDGFYKTNDQRIASMINALEQVIVINKNIRFAINLAKFARVEMFMRTTPIILLVQTARIARANKIPLDGLREAVSVIIQRVDQLTDTYAYALTIFENKKAVPIAIKRGVADAFNKFDEYQFGKYNRNDGLTLKQLIQITHPVPITEANSILFDKINKETVSIPYTWEVELSKNGQLPAEEQKSKAELWTELVNKTGSGSLGYMAILRNLRNLKDAGVSDDTWKTVAEKIQDQKAIEKAKQLPFGFINAYDIAEQNALPNLVLTALSNAMDLSISNVPKLGDNVWIILDTSGSMGGIPIKHAAIFTSILIKAAKQSFNLKVTAFDTSARHINANPNDSLITILKNLNAAAGGGTELQAALNYKSSLGFEPDTVIILSDMEVNALRSTKDVSKLFTKNCVKIAINLNSNESTPCGDRQGWIQLAGFSDRIFGFVDFTRKSSGIIEQLKK